MGSGFATAATDMGALHERISAASATLSSFEFPGEGQVERAFAAVQASLTADAEAVEKYTSDAATACSTQDSIDHGLEFAPTNRDLEELFVAQTSGDPKAKAKFDAAVEDYKQARIAHENSTLGNCFPTAPVGTCGVSTDDSFAGEGEGGSGEDDGDLSGLDGEGNEDEDSPVTMSEGGEGSAPVTMSEPGDSPRVQMSDGLPRPTPLSGDAVSTETSADSTIPPTAGAGGQLTQPTQATPGGQPIQGAHTTPNAAFGPSGGRSPQLGQPSAGARGTAPKSAQRKDDDTAAPITGVAGVASTAAPSSTASTPSGTGAGTPPPTTPPTGAPPSAPGQGGTGQVGGGGGLAGAGARPPGQALGSGETVTGQSNKPILRYEEPQPGDPGYDWFTHGETDDFDTDDKKGAA